MKRKLLSILLCAALTLSLLPAAGAAFTDITDETTAAAVAGLQSLGIISGTSETTYSPKDPLTRAQVCKIITGAMGIADQAATQARKNLFSDVLPSQWYTGYVNLAYSKNIINGYGNGTFGPNDHITYGQLATILLRMLGYSTKDIGSFWPIDYTEFCEKLGIHGTLDLDPYAVLDRGQAAILVYNALKQSTASGSKLYYETIHGVASVKNVLFLDADAADGAAEDLLMAYVISGSSAGVQYFERTRQFPEGCTGQLGALLLDKEGAAMGFVADACKTKDVVIASTKLAGLTDENGVTHRVGSAAVTLAKDSVQQWGAGGYLLLSSYAGRTARLFYEDNGSVAYVYLLSGKTTSATSTVLAQGSSVREILRALDVDDVSGITKNGAPAEEKDLARYDVCYFDPASRTLRASDFRISGSIEDASPSLEYADTITVAGCKLDVLEGAWESLAACKLYDYVTVLLTDDCKVAQVSTDLKHEAQMVGVLNQSGTSVTLCSSGLTLTASKLSADDTLRGKLVNVSASAGWLGCTAYACPTSERLNIAQGTLGEYSLAPAIRVYEHTGSGSTASYLCSLSGETGVASTDFEEIGWAEALPASAVTSYHLNSAGQVDLLLLKDVSGNCYDYGYIQRSTQGSRKGTSVTLQNAGGNQKISCNLGTAASGYAGITQCASVGGKLVSAYVKLINGGSVDGTDLFKRGNTWYLTLGGTEVPVSENVQVYSELSDRWLKGESGLQSAFAQGLPVTAYYDRTLTTGAQVRVLTVEKEA